MKMKQLLVFIFLFVGFHAALAQEAPKVFVKALQLNLPDGAARYQYRVINSGTKRIVCVAIGSDYYHGIYELKVLPTGWTFDAGLPAASSTSPSGWHADVITLEESPVVDIEWRNDGTADIMPGQTVSGFSVITPRPDRAYMGSHWTVLFSDSTVESALLVLDDNPTRVDNTPPNITVSLTPSSIGPPNGTLRAITANVSVHDDQDPNPAVKLVSITCNEPLGAGDIVANLGADSRTFSVRATRLGQEKMGRIYTATYSATDVSGNTATATATITVPHDQRQ